MKTFTQLILTTNGQFKSLGIVFKANTAMKAAHKAHRRNKSWETIILYDREEGNVHQISSDFSKTKQNFYKQRAKLIKEKREKNNSLY